MIFDLCRRIKEKVERHEGRVFINSFPFIILLSLAKTTTEEKRELVYKDEGQEYAQVIRLLGDGRLEANWFHL